MDDRLEIKHEIRDDYTGYSNQNLTTHENGHFRSEVNNRQQNMDFSDYFFSYGRAYSEGMQAAGSHYLGGRPGSGMMLQTNNCAPPSYMSPPPTIESRSQVPEIIETPENDVCSTFQSPYIPREFVCEVCNRSFPLMSSLKLHMRIHSGEKLFECDACPKSFTLRDHLEKHVLTHTGERPHECGVCYATFSQSSSLDTHMRIHTNVKARTESSENEDSVEEANDDKETNLEIDLNVSSPKYTNNKIPVECSVCQRSFSQRSSLKRHMQSQHMPQSMPDITLGSEEDGKKPETDNLVCLPKNESCGINEKKEFSCDICFRQFTASYYLKRHILTHSEGGLYKCEICSCSFRSSSGLRKHLNVHDKEEATADSSNTDSSLFSGKSGEYPLNCNICLMSFQNLEELKDHMVIHVQEKRFQCNICFISFKQQGTLHTHMRTHSMERPFKCKFCTKDFRLRDHLVKHIRTHTGEKPYSCSTCSKKFARSCALNMHMLIHTGERKYRCDICNKAFMSHHNLRSHNRTHTGEKPFSCESCDRRFSQRSALNIHMRIHLKNKV